MDHQTCKPQQKTIQIANMDHYFSNKQLTKNSQLKPLLQNLKRKSKRNAELQNNKRWKNYLVQLKIYTH